MPRQEKATAEEKARIANFIDQSLHVVLIDTPISSAAPAKAAWALRIAWAEALLITTSPSAPF